MLYTILKQSMRGGGVGSVSMGVYRFYLGAHKSGRKEKYIPSSTIYYTQSLSWLMFNLEYQYSHEAAGDTTWPLLDLSLLQVWRSFKLTLPDNIEQLSLLLFWFTGSLVAPVTGPVAIFAAVGCFLAAGGTCTACTSLCLGSFPFFPTP